MSQARTGEGIEEIYCHCNALRDTVLCVCWLRHTVQSSVPVEYMCPVDMYTVQYILYNLLRKRAARHQLHRRLEVNMKGRCVGASRDCHCGVSYEASLQDTACFLVMTLATSQ